MYTDLGDYRHRMSFPNFPTSPKIVFYSGCERYLFGKFNCDIEACDLYKYVMIRWPLIKDKYIYKDNREDVDILKGNKGTLPWDSEDPISWAAIKPCLSLTNSISLWTSQFSNSPEGPGPLSSRGRSAEPFPQPPSNPYYSSVITKFLINSASVLPTCVIGWQKLPSFPARRPCPAEVSRANQ